MQAWLVVLCECVPDHVIVCKTGVLHECVHLTQVRGKDGCGCFWSHLQAVVGHVDVSMHIGHWVLEVRAVDGCLPELGAALYYWLTLLPRNPAHSHSVFQSPPLCFRI